MKKITKAIIPAAGLGTRVLPATKTMPKEMLPIVDKMCIRDRETPILSQNSAGRPPVLSALYFH